MMKANLHRQTDLIVNHHGVRVRREFLRAIAAVGPAAAITWSDLLTLEAAELRRQGMACILLWMQGGPSQFETFSPKTDHDNGGETLAVGTSVSGIRIAENLPRTAAMMDDLCVIRSMTSKEGSHPRATFLLHTGYLPTASVKYPTLGSHVAHQIGDLDSDLPGFVRIGNRFRSSSSGGFLGVEYDPFVLSTPGRPPENTSIPTSRSRYQRRLVLLDRLEGHFRDEGAAREVADHKKLYSKSSRMILSSQMEAFDLQQEPESMRQAYGESDFAAGCLMARRLVEAGVTFVEVGLGNWDTHQDNFNRSRELCEQLDQPFAQLIADLKQRGMLDRTLVVWMGEFGRTPRINPRGGRDHYPRAFNVALAGGGVKGGQVIGATDAGGTSVADRPVTVSDLFRTFCHSLHIDPDHENLSPIGRPIKIVDGGQAVTEVFG